MRGLIGTGCGLLLPLVLFAAAPAAAQLGPPEGSGEAGTSGGVAAGAASRSGDPSAAQRAVWDFVHFVSSAEIVDVIDSFDDDDPFDLSLGVAYDYSLRRGKITRECRLPTYCHRDDGAGREFVDYHDIARYTQTTHTLDLLLAVGIYKDLHFYTRWPLVLSDSRHLDYEEGVNRDRVRDILGNQPVPDNPDPDLPDGVFRLPFDAPERSGLDYFTVGFSWAPFNQERDPTEPNWILNLEGRFGIGDVLTPTRSGGGDGGISRGVTELRFGMALSRRFRYLEPYSGLFAMAGFPKYETHHHYKDPVEGQINTMPPIVGTLLFGMEIIPWENLEREQKFWIGLEISGTYHSEGRDYSELFDALGAPSDDQRMMDPRLSYADGGPGCDPTTPGGGRQDTSSDCWWAQYGRDALNHFNGMTDVENYGTFAARLTLGIQAAKYVKFTAGLGFAHDQEHYITFTDECNSEPEGGCQIGQPKYNPQTREVIDAPGNRFRVQETTVFDVFAAVTAMF